MKVRATQDWGFVGHQGAPVRVQAGDEWEHDDPFVAAHPEMFTKPEAEEPRRRPARGRGAS